jgi:hypothetical protein
MTLTDLPTLKYVETTMPFDYNRSRRQYYNFTKTQTNYSTRKPKFAYVYVIGGCDPNQPGYRYYIYDIIINTYLQRLEGSTADTIIFLCLSYQ